MTSTTSESVVPGRRRRRFARSPRFTDGLLGAAGLAATLAVLELSTIAGLLPERTFPRITSDLGELAGLAGGSELWTAIGRTLQGWAISFAIAVVVAVLLGVAIGSSSLLRAATNAVIEFLRPIPSVALIPLVVLVLGTGLQSKVFLAAFAAAWPVLIATIYGMRDVEPVALETARAFRARPHDRLLSVVLPSAVPYIATGLRVASTTALILCVTAELVIGSPGLGQSITVAQAGGQYRLMYALIIATGLLGVLLNLVFVALERRLLRWHPSQRAKEVVQ
ncbi:ABC-type nitrate/sulfonate/bicarbonate transport system, permease component [Actinomadura meyerae]|uniref:ABC-type nitrate/sulfonate/bicarbonate transport system, permease component n=1 Tax=Actinomadura meyerae TaxID=240840 RepID=A0A239NNV2_9ACTN|nr:ABC transporter permease [Actinomadura meyerae]SNT56322.1 ABC-type nitrate/sulfonate/bicarbonate transport system, permease component [Actinomadura meyerae]